MRLLDKFQQKAFWINVLKVGLPFFLIVTVFSLLMASYGNFSLTDFEAMNKTLFSEGKWIRFWLSKIVISLGYGMYVTNKNMK